MKSTKKRILKIAISLILAIAMLLPMSIQALAYATTEEGLLVAINVELEYDMETTEIQAVVTLNEEMYALGLITEEDIKIAVSNELQQVANEDIVFQEFISEIAEPIDSTGQPADSIEGPVNSVSGGFWTVVGTIICVIAITILVVIIVAGIIVTTYAIIESQRIRDSWSVYGWSDTPNPVPYTQYQYEYEDGGTRYVYC